MRISIFKTFLVLSFISSFSAFAKEIKVQSRIKSATVYLQGANITRASHLSLAKGEHDLVFKGISTGIERNSIQVQAGERITLLGISHDVHFKEDKDTPVKIQALKDSLEVLTVQKLSEQNGRYAYQEELNMILKNQAIKGQQTLNIDDIREFSALYRMLIPEIKSKILISDLLIKELDIKIRKVNDELRKFQSQVKERESVITVKIEVHEAHKGVINLSYYTRHAYWKPEYDIRAKSIGEDINLTYKANVVQMTGYDWNEVELELSSGNPSLKGNVYDLSTWWLDYYWQNNRSDNEVKKEGYLMDMVVLEERNVFAAQDEKPRAQGNNKSKSFSRVRETESGTNHNFKITRKYSIPSQQKATSVEIKRTNISTEYKYKSVPKKDQDAFLMARLTDWNKLNLLPGNSSIYFEGNYVSKSFIDPYGAEDTLSISLGRDKNIRITRERVKDETQNVFASSSKKRRIEWKTSVKNNKSEAVTIVVQDQIPVSKRKELMVELENFSNAEYDEKTGVLTWEISLEANASIDLKFAYTVKYPKGQKVKLE